MKNEHDRYQEINLMTQTTYRKLKKQLESLRSKYEKAMLSLGETAGINCDWHDNFAYDQACQDSQIYSRQVQDLEIKLQAVELIKPRLETEKVGIGNIVIVQFSGEKSSEKFTILGPDDFDPEQGWISFQSQVGNVLMGKRTGETVPLEINKNHLTIKVLKILPGDFK